MSDLEALLRSRRSVRSFKPELPARELIERVLDLAITAPSASNKQPWRFLVVHDKGTIMAMAAAVRAAVDHVATHVPESSQPSFRAYGEYFTRFEHAPVVIVPIHRGHTVLSHLVDDALDSPARECITNMERDSGLIGTSLALMSLLLAAQDAGLGASAMTGPLLAVHELRAILRVPASLGLVALVPIGYADEEPRPTERKPLSAVVRWIP
jgi:nitroreductase